MAELAGIGSRLTGFRWRPHLLVPATRQHPINQLFEILQLLWKFRVPSPLKKTLTNRSLRPQKVFATQPRLN